MKNKVLAVKVLAKEEEELESIREYYAKTQGMRLNNSQIVRMLITRESIKIVEESSLETN